MAQQPPGMTPVSEDTRGVSTVDHVVALSPLIDHELRSIRTQLPRVVDSEALRTRCEAALHDAVADAKDAPLRALTSVAVRAIREAILDYLQACARGEVPSPSVQDESGHMQGDGEGIPAAQHARDRTAALRAALAELPEHMRVVVRESFLRDRSVADIAEDLGQPEHVVVGARAEALTLLRTRVAARMESASEHSATHGPRREKWERAQALT